MLEGVDLENSPEWVAECEATLDSLDQIGPGQRIYWLSVPLGSTGPLDKIAGPANAALSDFRDAAGLPRATLSAGNWSAVSSRPPGSPKPSQPCSNLHPPPSPKWSGCTSTRCVAGCSGPRHPRSDDMVSAALLTNPRSGTALSEPILDEGGQSDLPTKSPARLNPVSRRYLKVTNANAIDDPEPSYQTLAVVAEVPDAGMAFPAPRSSVESTKQGSTSTGHFASPCVPHLLSQARTRRP